MNDILFGNNNKKIINRISKQYFRKNKVRNLAAVLAVFLTAFLFTSITSLAFSMVSSLQLSMQMQKGSKGDGTFGYMTEEQFELLKNSDFVEKAGHRRVIGYASNSAGHSIELNYADSIQQELTFCVPTHGTAPEKANEIATTELALKALGVEPKIGAEVPLEFEIRGKSYHYDMVLSGWWEASNDTVSVALLSEKFVKENPDVVKNTRAQDRELSGTTFSEVILKDKKNIKEQMDSFVYSIGGDPKNMDAENFILSVENQMGKGMISLESILLAVVFILMFIMCGYLLIYNIFDISVMQDVRQYGLLRMIGTSTRQIKRIVNRQAVWLTLIGLPAGLVTGFFAGRALLPVVMEIFSYEYSMADTRTSASPILFLTAALFTILTVFISTRKPAKKAAKVSPLEAIRYTEQNTYKKKTVNRTRGAKLSRMAFSNLGRNRRRSVFIMVSMLLCIVLFNSVIIVTQSMDEEKWLTRTTKTDFTVYNSIAINVQEGFRYHEDALPQQAVDMICQQEGLKNERYLYRNTADDSNVLVDYGFEDLVYSDTAEYKNGVSKVIDNYSMHTAADEENLFYGNVFGASEHFWENMTIYEGENDPTALKKKMAAGEYVIIGNRMDRLSGGPKNTPMTDQIKIGDSISFYRDGSLVKTCTVLAKACTVGTEDETPTTTTAAMNIGGDAPFVYLPDRVFKEIYENPTLLSFGFDVDSSAQPQMENFLNSYTEKNPSVAYTSTKLLKEQLKSIESMVLVVGGLIGCIMALAGLINFTNMIITNIITRRHEFATMQSIGMTNRQLRRLMVYEGVYYAVGADVTGGVTAAVLALTVLKGVLNSPSMWFFTLHVTLIPAVVIGVLYLVLAAIIPLIVLRFFNKGTVVERLRISE